MYSVNQLPVPNREEQELIRLFELNFQRTTGKACRVIVANRIDDLLRRLSIKEILDVVELFNLPGLPSLRSGSRKRELVNLRKIFCHLAKRAGYHLCTIGNELGSRDHTTVIYSIRGATNHLQTEPEFKYLYQAVESKLMILYEGRLEQDWKIRSKPQSIVSAIL